MSLTATVAVACGAHDVAARVDLARFAHTTADISALDELARCPDSFVRSAVARNPHVFSADAAVGRLLHDTQDVVWELAGNPAITEPAAQHLAGHHTTYIRERLARNAAVAQYDAVMRTLVRDVEDVRRALATNPALPEAIMRRLAKDTAPNVRRLLAGNKAVLQYESVFRWLEVDDNPAVRAEIVFLMITNNVCHFDNRR